MQRLYGKDFFVSPRTPIFISSIHNHAEMQVHDHDFIEIVIVFKGIGQHCTIYGKNKIRAGDVILIRPGTWHSYRKCRGLGLINICFGFEMFHRELNWITEDPSLSQLFWGGVWSQKQSGILKFRVPDKVVRFCLKQTEAKDIIKPDNTFARQALNTGILLTVISFLSPYAPPLTAGEGNFSMHPSVMKGIRLFKEGYSKEWNLEKLSQDLGVNKYYLVRLFKLNTGLTPMSYLSRIRSEQAATFLLSTDKNISEIGIAVGWDDPNYFARCFRKYFGISATEYRLKMSKV